MVGHDRFTADGAFDRGPQTGGRRRAEGQGWATRDPLPVIAGDTPARIVIGYRLRVLGGCLPANPADDPGGYRSERTLATAGPAGPFVSTASIARSSARSPVTTA